MVNIETLLAQDFYIAVEDSGVDECTIAEINLGGDRHHNTALSALDNATWNVSRIYRINLAKREIQDVTEDLAIVLWHEWRREGGPLSEQVFSDFILQHIPASYDVGYRGPVCDAVEYDRLKALCDDDSPNLPEAEEVI